MTIEQFLLQTDARIALADMWLCAAADTDPRYTVYQRKAYQKYTRVLLGTNELGLALETMVGMNAIGAQGAE